MDHETDSTISSSYLVLKNYFLILHSLLKYKIDLYISSILYIIIDYLQVLSYLFPLTNSPNYTVFQWDYDFTYWLSIVTNGLRITSFLELDDNSRFILFIFAIITLLLNVLLFIVAIFKSYINIDVSIILKYYCEIIYGPLYIPVLSAFAIQLTCYDNTCWQNNNILISLFSILFGGIFIIFSLLYTATYYVRNPTYNSVLSVPHPKVQTVHMIIKSTYVVMFQIIYSENYSFLLVIMLILLNLIGFYFHLKLLPYYHWTFNLIKSSYFGLLVWTSFCIGFKVLISDTSSYNVAVMYFFICPFVVGACIITLNLLKQNLLYCPVVELESPMDFELKCRFLLEPITEYMLQKNLEFGYFDNFKSKIPHGYKYEILPTMQFSPDEHQIISREYEKILEEVHDIYSHGRRRFPGAAMSIFRAQYYICYTDNLTLSNHALTNAENHEPNFEEIFAIYSMRTTQDKDLGSQNDIVQYISWQKFQEDARHEDENATRYQLAFWCELLKATPDLHRLHDLAGKIDIAMNLGQEHFLKLLKINPNSPQFLRIFASFIIDVLNQPDRGKEMLQKADELEESKTAAGNSSTNDEFNLLDDKCAVISVSGSKERLGEVLNTNTGVVKLLGYSKHELLAGNISRIIPTPYSSIHNSFILKYLETGHGININNISHLFAVHKSGFLVSVEMHLQEVSDFVVAAHLGSNNSHDSASNSSIFVAAIRAFNGPYKIINTPATREVIATNGAKGLKHEYCFVDSQYNVINSTPGCATLFGASIDNMRSGKIEVASWIDNFYNILELVQKGEGMDVNIFIKNRVVVKCGCKLVMQQVGHESIFICQFSLPQLLVQNALVQARRDTKNDTDFCDLRGDDSKLVPVAGLPGMDSGARRLKKERVGSDAPLLQDAEPQRIQSFRIANFDTLAVGDAFNFNFDNIISKEVADFENWDNAVEWDYDPTIDWEGVNNSSANIEMVNPFTAVEEDADNINPVDVDDIVASKTRRIKSVFAPDSDSTSKFSNKDYASAQSKSLHHQLQKFAKSSGNSSLSSVLKRFQYIIFGTALFLFITAILKFSMVSMLLDKYSSQIICIYSAGRIRFLTSRITSNVFNCLIGPHTSSYLSTGFISSQRVNEVRASIVNDLKEMSSLDNYLFLTRKGDLTSSHLILYNQQIVPYYTYASISGVESYTMSLNTLHDATSLFIADARAITAINTDLIVATNVAANQILRNGISDFFQQLNVSTSMYVDDTSVIIAQIFSWALSLTILSIIFVFLVVFIVAKPTIWLIEENKKSVLLLFTHIKPSILNSFQKKCSERLRRLQLSHDDANADDEDEEFALKFKNINFDNADTELDDKAVQVSSEDAILKSHETATALKNSYKLGSNHFTLFKFILLIILSIVYFITSYWYDYGIYADEFSANASEVNWGLMRSTYFQICAFIWRRYLLQGFIASNVGGSTLLPVSNLEHLYGNLTILSNIEAALSYGSKELNINLPSGDQSKLAFENACSSFSSSSGCSTFYQGVLSQGLHPGMINIVYTFNSAISPILSAIGSNNSNPSITVLNSTLNNNDMNVLYSFENYYLESIFALSNTSYVSKAQNIANKNSLFRVLFLVAFILILTVFVFLYLNQLLWTLNLDQKHTTVLLLMIPPKVMEKMDALRNFVTKLALENGITND